MSLCPSKSQNPLKLLLLGSFFNISNDVGRVKGHGAFFCRLRTHVSRQRRRAGSFRESNDLAASMIHVQPYGSARFSSSVWWLSPPDISSVTLDHDVLCKLPSLWGGGWPIQLTRSLQGRTTVEIRHPRMGFPPPAAIFHGGRTLRSQSDRAS